MKITEIFVEEILKKNFPTNYQRIYDDAPMLQYLDKKMNAVHGNSKTRRSLANIYAIYSILYFYKQDFFNNKSAYKCFEGYDYTKLFCFYRNLYGGSKLQNHALNSRVNGEFHNKIKNIKNDLIIINNGKYLIHIDYLYSCNRDISKVSCEIIEKYIELLIAKDHALIQILNELQSLNDYNKKISKLLSLLNEDAEARIFEIISYAILKTHYKNIKVYFGYSKENVKQKALELYKTGRTNANDGGIDFVMRPVGRFFQVTEVNNYDKYLLDIDKVMHFPVSFVIKTNDSKEKVMRDLELYINERSGGMKVLKERYMKAIEEIITINELREWTEQLANNDIDEIIRDIDIYYKLEMHMDEE